MPSIEPIDDDAPRMEPWLVVCLVAFIPLIATAFTPRSWLPILIGATIIPLAAGVIMAVRQIRVDDRRRRERLADRKEPDR
jgi:cadmium resistance protein CadD (predicted permease)